MWLDRFERPEPRRCGHRDRGERHALGREGTSRTQPHLAEMVASVGRSCRSQRRSVHITEARMLIVVVGILRRVTASRGSERAPRLPHDGGCYVENP